MHNIKDINNIGENIKIINASDKSKVGITGIVIYETKELLVIRNSKNILKKINKNEILKIKKM